MTSKAKPLDEISEVRAGMEVPFPGCFAAGDDLDMWIDEGLIDWSEDKNAWVVTPFGAERLSLIREDFWTFLGVYHVVANLDAGQLDDDQYDTGPTGHIHLCDRAAAIHELMEPEWRAWAAAIEVLNQIAEPLLLDGQPIG